MTLQRRRLLQLGAAACGVGIAGLARAQRDTAGSTALHLLRTGDIGALPWIELPIDGRPTRWLVDSAATTALIAPPLAAHLRLARLSPVRVATAGGVQTLDRYSLPALPVLGGAGPAATAVAIDLAGVLGAAGATLDGVLGAPWLRDVATTFDFAGGTLRWRREPAGPPQGRTPQGGARRYPDDAATPSPRAATLPLRWDGGLPVVQLALGERERDTFLFDTGNAGALVVFAQRAQGLLADAGVLPETTVRELGGTVRARHARIERLSAPGFIAREVPAALESGTAARRGGHFDRLAGSLGVALFEAGAVTLDGPGGRLIVELPGLPEPAPLPGGFGLALGLGDGAALIVSAVIDGGPAAAAGIAAGDVVHAIDGIDVRRWSPAQAWQALAGRASAVFETARAGVPPRRVELQRQRFFPLLR